MSAPIESDCPYGVSRYGVPARIGGRVVFDGKSGVITGFTTEAAYVLVLLDGDAEPVPCHPTWRMTYLTASPDSTPKG